MRREGVLPYFETLLDHLDQGNSVVQDAFGQHVHWGFWDEPTTVLPTAAEFGKAAEAMLERTVRGAAIRDGARLLDVGCGLGGTIAYLNERYRDCMLVGINIDRRQIRIAEKAIPDRDRNLVQFAVADAAALPFGAESFDIVLCIESIGHFRSRRSFIADCTRVLKPGGRLVISDFVSAKYFCHWTKYFENATHWIGDMYGEVRGDVSLARYQRFARSNGLECVTIDDVTANTLPTYRFLRSIFDRADKQRIFRRATLLLELGARTRLVRYLILTFRKPAWLA